MFLCGEADLRGYQPASKGNSGESEDHWYKYTGNFVSKTLDGSLHVGVNVHNYYSACFYGLYSRQAGVDRVDEYHYLYIYITIIN